MGKLSGLITTVVFVGAIAFLVYLCCRNKRKRSSSWNSWGNVFGQNQQTCPGITPGQHQQIPAICPPGGAANYDRTVPHSIVTLPGHSQYPGANPGWSYPGQNPTGYSGQNPTGYPPPNPTGYPGQGYGGAPYPMGPTGMPMPMPGTAFESTQQTAYPAGYPEDLPPPYSAVVGPGPKY